MNRLIRVNLLPEKEGLKLPKLPIGTILGVFILGAFSYYLFYPALETENEKIDDLERQVRALKKEKKQKYDDKKNKINAIVSQISEQKRRINLVKSIVTGDDVVTWSKVLEALTEVTSFQKKGNGIWLTKFSVQKDYRASFSGVAENDWAVLSNFVDKLKANEYFSEVNLTTGVKNSMDDGEKNVPVYHFEIDCRVNKEKL